MADTHDLPASSSGVSDHDKTPLTEADLPDPTDLPELTIISRSTIFYWWPVWLLGYGLAILTFLQGDRIKLSDGKELLIHPNSGVGITFVAVLTLVMIFTNVKLRGVYSVVFILALAFIAVLFAWLHLWDEIFALIPALTIYMNIGFYLTFSTVLFTIWLMRFFIFDRLLYWRLRPGQLTVQRVVGGGEQSYDTRGMLFEQRSDDFFRHKILGLGSGDLLLITTGARKEEIDIPNVLFAQKKVKLMQRLIAVKPEEMLSKSTMQTHE